MIEEVELCDNISVDSEGNLCFAGYNTVELAEKYATPLYIVDENKIRSKIRAYKSAMSEYYNAESFPIFASKAMSFKRMYKILVEEDIGCDVVSCGEFYTALQAGTDPKKVFYHGNNKTDEDIKFAIDNGMGYFVVDNYEELISIDNYAKEKNIKQKILLRITPGIDPHTLKAIDTGSIDCKFGFALETGQAEEITALALKLDGIDLMGFHCHIGSQIFDAFPFIDTVDIMISYLSDIRDKYGYIAKILNLGGGFAVRYVASDPEFNIKKCISDIGNAIHKKCNELKFPVPIIVHEPGRCIVADAGMTLYTVGNVKEIKDFKNFVSVNGGMGDNPRYALYGSEYTVTVANKADKDKDFICTLAGKFFERGDLIFENIKIQKPEKGDVIAVMTTGAYNFSMASNYNRFPRPAVVMLDEEKDYLAVKRETYEDLIKNDI